MNITTVEYTGAGTRRDVVVEEIQQQQSISLHAMLALRNHSLNKRASASGDFIRFTAAVVFCPYGRFPSSLMPS